MDENIPPGVAFPPDYVPEPDELEGKSVQVETQSDVERSFAPAFLAFGKETASRRKPLFIGAIAVAVVASVAVIGVPAGWYSKKAPATQAATVSQAPAPVSTTTETSTQPQPSTAEAAPATEDAAAAAKRQREKERKAREAKIAESEAAAAAPAPEGVKPGAKRVVVTVTYDESGRVTQASGGDANALRIARQKRFPPGKAGSATVSIPIN